MENQEIDESAQNDSVEDETENEEEESGSADDKNADANKSKSNFKALYKSNKEKEKLLEQKDRELAEAKAELKNWQELNPDEAAKIQGDKKVDTAMEEIFTIKNPEAEPHLKEIRKTMAEFNMNLAQAWKFVKADLPAESVSKRDFEFSKTTPKKEIDLSKVAEEDTPDLTKEQRSEWRKLHWYT